MRRPVALLLALPLAACGESAAPVAEPTATPEFRSQAGEAEPARPEGRHLLARVESRTLLRARPGGRVLARIGRRTEFGSARVLGVVTQRDGWLKVIATERPNGRFGWIPEARARVYGTDFAIHVDRSRRRLTLRHAGRVRQRMKIAVGRADTPTPLGRFAVTDKLRPSRPDSPYGCCVVALNGHQTKLVPGWIGGDRLAIHATPSTWSIGQAASLGCMRGHARDMRRLMRAIPLGTPVFVRA